MMRKMTQKILALKYFTIMPLLKIYSIGIMIWMLTQTEN